MNSKTTSTADIPRGSTPLPAPVLDAYKELIDVCAKNKVPLRTLFSIESIDQMNDLLKTIKRQREIIGKLEKQLGIGDDI